MTTTTAAGLSASINAVEMIREDHRRIRALFREFESAAADVRPGIAARALDELELHTAAEEEHFYPALRRIVGVDAVLEAREAHHAAALLMAELRLMPTGRRFNAKFKALAEVVLAHMKDEESRLLPAAEGSRLDLQEVAREMTLDKYRELGRRELGGTGGNGATFGPLLAGAVLAVTAWFLLTPSGE